MQDLASAAAALPDAPTLRRWLLARTVIAVCREPLSRWGRSECFELRPNGWAVFRSQDGSGDEWSATFTPEGAVVRLFSHESEVSPYARRPATLYPGLLDGLPPELRPAVFDPAFDAGFDGAYLGVPSATVLLWMPEGAAAWMHGTPLYPENAHEGLWHLGDVQDSEGMLEHLSEYAEEAPPSWAVEWVYRGAPLTQEVVSAFNPERLLCDVLVETSAMGYPQT